MTQVTTKYRQRTNEITSPINDIPFMVNLTGGLVKQLVCPPKIKMDHCKRVPFCYYKSIVGRTSGRIISSSALTTSNKVDVERL